MATAGDRSAPYESSRAGEKLYKRPFLPDLNEEPENVSQEAERNVCQEEVVSPADLANIYKGSTIGSGQAQRQDSKLINNKARCFSITSMASLQHPTTMENLPDELFLNIFIRLFAKQLAQMRSVSKSWNALLSQSSFIKSHLHRSIQNSDRILLAFYDVSLFDFGLFTAYPYQFPNLELTGFIKLPVNPKLGNNSVLVIGAVNGLICFSYSNSIIHIWNPSLSAVLTLLPYSMPSAGNDSIQIHIRFGFDPKTDDYKVVKLTALIGLSKCVVNWWLEVKIYSMRKGSWEVITGRFPSHIINIINCDYLCVDGHSGYIHWLGYISEKFDSERIVAFDLGSEIFREIPLPDSTLEHNRLNCLGTLARKLCVMSWVKDVGCEVWVMDEYGVVESWVKRYVFPWFIGTDTHPFGFTLQNEFLVDYNGLLVLHDPVANKAKVLENYFHEKFVAEKIVEYVDSLVWLAPAECEMVDGAGQI